MVLISLIQIVSIMYIIPCTCSGESAAGSKHITVYCVVSTSNIHNVCQGYNFTEQNTLYHYMKFGSKYFKSYQTYVFESGYHSLFESVQLKVAHRKHLTLAGPDFSNSSTQAVIDCNGTASSFRFQDSSNITITNLTFSSCIQQHSHKVSNDSGKATLIFLSSIDAFLIGVKVLMSVDQAFFFQYVFGNLHLHNVEVANSNTAGKSIPNSGNAIVYERCHHNAKSNLSVMNSRFVGNSNHVRKSTVQLLGAGGLTIIMRCPNVTVKISNLTMVNNSGYNGGNLALFMFAVNVSVEITNSMFESGKASYGGGLFIHLGEITYNKVSCNANYHQQRTLHINNTKFTKNTAYSHGGGVYLQHMESLSCESTENVVTFEYANFNENSVKYRGLGGGIALHSYTLMITGYLYHGNPQLKVFLKNCYFHDNYVKVHAKGGSGTGVVFAKLNHFLKLTNTTIFNNKATGIVGMKSNIILSQNITIINNTGFNAGGMLLCQNAVTYFDAYTSVSITKNTADNTGGGICVETEYLESRPTCFFQLGHDPLLNKSLVDTIKVSISDNLAGFAGSNIFGGSIDYCYVIQLSKVKHNSSHNINIYKQVFKVPRNTISFSSVSSPPRDICLCQKMTLHCKTLLPFQLHKFPGETFSIDVVLVGQFKGTVPGTVQASLKSRHSSIKQGEFVQNVSSTDCNQLNYTIYSRHSHEVLHLRVQRVGDISGFEASLKSNKFTIDIRIKDCPFAFNLTDDIKNSSCDCGRLLKSHSDYVYCDIMTQTVKRSPPAWIGIIEKGNSSNSVAFHSFCPFDYCLSSKVDLFATSNSLSQDAQCAFNRTGVLCGSCSDGLSVVFGSTKCHHCSNYWLLLIILFALSGTGFLIVLILFDFTIADGTLSGIIFYFNIIGSNLPVFFPEHSEQNITAVTSLLKVVISLINLGTGASMCLFHGMDAYIKAWLDFCFPLYLWILTGCFIFFAGSRCSWIVRRNAVKVLATFILLSYTRLLTAIAGALQVSEVQLEHQKYELRWLADGNIKYFRGKHILLAIFSVMFGLLLLPFALCLLFFPCLQKVSHKKAFSWVDRLKPFFDVYTGPFTASGRFWTGLLLFFRFILLFITAVNFDGNPNTVLGAISITVVLLLLIAGLLPAGLYRRRCLSALEYSSLINLGILSSLMFIFTYSTVISHVFVSVEILVFIGVIVHHFLKLKIINQSSCLTKTIMFLKYARLLCRNKLANRAEIDNDEAYNNITQFPYYVPEDREPLLATDNE